MPHNYKQIFCCLTKLSYEEVFCLDEFGIRSNKYFVLTNCVSVWIIQQIVLTNEVLNWTNTLSQQE